MNNFVSLIRLAVASCLALLASSVQAKNRCSVIPVENPVPVTTVHDVQGFFGERMALNRDVYLKEFPIEKYVDFVVNRQHTAWDWTQAEQHGKWLESAYMSALQADDQQLLDKARQQLYRIIDSQEESGYLGATSRDYRSAERPIRGMDPYELYFVFHALITVYEETADQHALQSAQRLADYFLDNFGPGKQEFWPSPTLRSPDNRRQTLAGTSQFAGHSVHYCWEGTLLADPIARLYVVTGKKKYLDWSQWVVANIDRWGGWDAFTRLDSVADGRLGVDALQPYVHSHTFHMNFMGFLRLYMITGDKSLLRKVEGAWADINRRQMYITGGVSVAEHYEHGYVKPLSGNIVETCATMSWMQLTQMLLQLTGDIKYADAIERLMLNHVLAAQDAETGVCRYHTAPNGAKPSGYFHGPDCCTASGHRIISLLPTFFYAEQADRFFINQYIPSTYEGKKLQFQLTGDYPASDQVTLRIKGATSRPLSISLRMPGWCASPKVSVNGEPVKATPGTYLTIERHWQAGDSIMITLPMEERWVKREHHSNYPSYQLVGGEIMYREEPTDEIPYAFMRGPVVYCLDMVWNASIGNDDMEVERDFRMDVTEPPVRIEGPQELMAPCYQTGGFYMGAPVKVLLTPFANIGRWHRDDGFVPNPSAKAFTYATWLYAH